MAIKLEFEDRYGHEVRLLATPESPDMIRLSCVSLNKKTKLHEHVPMSLTKATALKVGEALVAFANAS